MQEQGCCCWRGIAFQVTLPVLDKNPTACGMSKGTIAPPNCLPISQGTHCTCMVTLLGRGSPSF